MDDTALFFKPRQAHVQGRLDFCRIPPDRIVAFPVQATDFIGLSLHWNGSESVACRDPANCALHKLGNVPRDYFFAPAYVHDVASRRWQRVVFPVGDSVRLFADRDLRGRAWKIGQRVNKQNRKNGLTVMPFAVPAQTEKELAELPTFDITDRLLVRYNVQ